MGQVKNKKRASKDWACGDDTVKKGNNSIEPEDEGRRRFEEIWRWV